MKGPVYSSTRSYDNRPVPSPAEGQMPTERQDFPGDGDKMGARAKVSRSVDKLDAEQLVRKRAADRKSQQILRQKTRTHIEGLEDRLRYLEDQKSEYELAQQRTIQLEEELRQLKETIESVPNKKFENNPFLPTVLPQAKGEPLQQPVIPLINKSDDPFSSTILDNPYSSSTLTPARIDSVQQFRSSFVTKSDLIPLPQPTEYIIPTPEPGNDLLSYSSNTKRTRKQKGPRLDSVSLRSSSPTLRGAAQHPYFIPPSLLKQPSVHAWEIPLNLEAPTSPVDKILCGLIETQKALVADGVSRSVAIGSMIPNVNVLIAPHLSHLTHPVSRVICDLLKRLPYRSLIDKLGAVLVMYPVYQWQIMNDYESYAKIPPFLVPVLSQRTIQHAVWICALGSAPLRDIVIGNPQKYGTEDFIYTLVSSLNCNWKRDIRDAISWGKDGVILSKDFCDHCHVGDNWSVDPPFGTIYPELRGAVRFTEDDIQVGATVEEIKG